MAKPSVLFWDVGGVLLSNAWDHAIRRRAVEHFQLDPDQFEMRHERADAALEKGQLTLDEYLNRTVFHQPRLFTMAAFRDWMFAQSTANPETLALAGAFARSKRYLMATLNNESRELNEYRIGKFGLRDYFAVFFSSCYLGVRKPEDPIYRLALQLTQRAPEECVFIDDRPPNVEAARRCGMQAIQFESAETLKGSLGVMGLEI